MRLLLVDDNHEFLEAAERFLMAYPEIEIAGKAHSGEEALLLADQLQPDLILMDIAMPEMNGLEATRKIKTKSRAPRIIILTLYDNPEYRAVSEQIQADGFVTKSEMTRLLLPLIREIFTQPTPSAPLKEKSMKHILIVDDSLTMRRMIKASLQRLPDIRISEAENGLAAIEKLALMPVDLMVLDLNMPDMHGLEVLKFVRSHGRYQTIPIVILTTRGDETSREEALATGATLYLTKPFDPHSLSTRIGELLGVR